MKTEESIIAALATKLLNSFLILCAACAEPVLAESLEYHVKAAYLLNFARYTKWEESSQSKTPLVICTFGKNPFEAVGYFVESRSIGERPVSFRFVRDRLELEACHVIYLPHGEERQLPSVLRNRGDQEVLVVTEQSLVGAINFVVTERKIRFDVNLAVAERGGISLDSQLLKLAVVVSKGQE